MKKICLDSQCIFEIHLFLSWKEVKPFNTFQRKWFPESNWTTIFTQEKERDTKRKIERKKKKTHTFAKPWNLITPSYPGSGSTSSLLVVVHTSVTGLKYLVTSLQRLTKDARISAAAASAQFPWGLGWEGGNPGAFLCSLFQRKGRQSHSRAVSEPKRGQKPWLVSKAAAGGGRNQSQYIQFTRSEHNCPLYLNNPWHQI